VISGANCNGFFLLLLKITVASSGAAEGVELTNLALAGLVCTLTAWENAL
jgi:hypothetical protein